MFDTVRNSKRVVQVILALIILPFAFWGVESYVQNVGPGTDLAKVGDIKITPSEFQQSVREQQDRLRATLGKDFDPAMLDTPQARQALLESLINQRLLGLQARNYALLVSDQHLGETILDTPALQVDGKFSRQRYEQLLRAQGLNEAIFESRLRQDLSLQQLSGAVGDGAIVARAEVDRWVALQTEVREISELRLRPEDYASRVKVSQDQIAAYYDANRAAFEIPESVRAEYAVLSASQLLDMVTVGEDQLKEAYQARKDQFALPEERRASHILVQVPKDATPERQAEARARATEILNIVRKNPDQFAKIAKERSDDPGSASNGGDLGFFARGAMVKAFEEAAFALKENDISDLVQSEFGFHIIKLTQIKAAAGRSFEDVKAELEIELRQQAASRKFAEVAESFSNTVYEQPDSLQPAAEKFKLSVKKTGWIQRGKVPEATELANEKVLAALFSEDATKKRRNIEAVEIAPNTLLSARVIEHKPAQLRPLEEVRGEVENRLVREEAAKLARTDGQEKLARLAKGEDAGISWGASKTVRRAGDPAMSVQAIREIFRLDGTTLPAYAGGNLPDGGYGLYKLTAIKRPDKVDPQVRAAVIEQLTRLAAEQDFTAYLGTLRERYPVSVNAAALESR